MNMKHVRRSKSGSFEDDLDVGMPLSPDHTIEYSDSQDTTTLPAPGAVDSQQQNTNLETTNLINSQSQRNYILSLLFEHSNKCITTSNQYDPSVRYGRFSLFSY